MTCYPAVLAGIFLLRKATGITPGWVCGSWWVVFILQAIDGRAHDVICPLPGETPAPACSLSTATQLAGSLSAEAKAS